MLVAWRVRLPQGGRQDLTRKCLIAEAWCPISKYEEAQSAVRRGAQRSGAQMPSIVNVIDTDEKPPTSFRQNKFTAGFQAIVDGCARGSSSSAARTHSPC